MKIHIALCLLAAAIASCHAQPEPEHAKLPYATVYKAVTMQFEQIETLTNRHVRFAMLSKLPNVSPRDIRLYIDSRTGRIPLELSSDGTFTLPVSADLMEENPFIVANQPRGTMKLAADITLRGKLDSEGQLLAEQHKARYRYLFSGEGIVDGAFDHAIEALPDSDVNRKETISSFEFQPTPPTNAPALIQSADGDIRVKPDQDGVIRIKYDPKLAKENPW